MNSDKTFSKRIPASFKEAAVKSLSYYPELKDVDVRFRFTRKNKKSVMVAQPVIGTMFNPFRKTAYVIRSSPQLKFAEEAFSVADLPENVLVGWLTHELGHVMDYRGRSALAMVWFGLAYLLFKRFMMGAERRADQIAIRHGCGDFIMSTKKFILEHASISPGYKKRIRRLYMAPDEAIELINSLNSGDQSSPEALQ